MLRFLKLTKFKNSGVWKDFQNSQSVYFAPKTLIYGFNGSGKTTLSRLFASVQIASKEEKLPSQAAFEVELTNNTKLNSDSLINPFEGNLLVFNQDFVARNFSWDDSKAEGIAYIAEGNIVKKAEYEAAVKAFDEAGVQLEKCIEQKNKADKSNKDFKTDVAKRIREMAPKTRYTQSYDARKIDPAYAEREYSDDDILTDQDLKSSQMLLGQEAPLPKISELAHLPPTLAEDVTNSFALLSASPGQAALDEFQKHPKMLQWANAGFSYHSENNVDQCLFCGNELSVARGEQLKALFDGAWDTFTKKLEQAQKYISDHQQLLRDRYQAIPRNNDFQLAQRAGAEEKIQAYKQSVEQLGKFVGDLKIALEHKRQQPTLAISLPPNFSDFEIVEFSNGFHTQNEELNGFIVKHNTAHDDFERQQEAAFMKIRNHVLGSERDKQSEIKLACVEAQKAEREMKEQCDKAREKRDVLHNELSNHGLGAEKLNRLIAMYLGHKDIQLKALDIGYELIRADGKPAKFLSEGEKTALSFCYFLTLFSAEGRKVKDLVVVIDDPISSLDTSAQTHAFSLLSRMTKKCAQTIILTHNLTLMNMVKREFQNLQKRKPDNMIASLLSLDCRNDSDNTGRRTTQLVGLDPLLKDYDTEYHFLFKVVYEASESGYSAHQFLLPNATRKLLEMFVAFASPDEPNFTAALMANHQKLQDKLEIKPLERLIQIESHGTIEGVGNLPQLTVEEGIRAAQAAMKYVAELAPIHFKSMKKLVSNE